MKNSRRKGKEGELEVARILREKYGYNARRGQQFSGGNGDADVEGLPGIHIEVKRREKNDINAWLSQSILDSLAASAKHGREMLPTVFHRQNADPTDPVKGQWKVTMKLTDWMKLYQAASKTWERENGR